MKKIMLFSLLIVGSSFAEDVPPIGYSDTPKLPHVDWKVHDIDRPRPEYVKPAELPTQAPADAIVLFDGTDLSNFIGPKGAAPGWKVEDGYMEIVKGGDLYTKEHFGSCQLHIEWRSPTPTQSSSQKRGNSGVFFMDQYEIQVLDCWENLTYADGMAGGLYGQYPPLVNAVKETGGWNYYDIIFTAPKWADGKIASKAYVTVLLNGVLVQNHNELLGPTRHKAVANYDKPHAEKGPIRLQDHKDNQAVRFRNMWVRPL
ncbi:MAG: hypothetical protein ACI9TH_003818 [Kiritimatiellia bacterium]|jgi:hypothetical protein